MTYTQSFPIQFASEAAEEALVYGANARFAVLTSRLLRMEFSPTASFEDRPSQVFWYRKQSVPEFKVRRKKDCITIETKHLVLCHRPNEAGFSADSLTVTLKASGAIWHFGQKDPLNLKGTARTLDETDGAVALEDGLISRSGWSLWDDSQQLLFTQEGWLTARDEEAGYQDLYFFGFGDDYYACLQDFSKVAGSVPMLPCWALGNWWSRYWAYSADELLALMDEFQSRQVPLSVCIVDMDWHIVNTGNSSSGWTGYTWNKDLFPDPEAFIAALHRRGLKTALNLHPAEGIHPHEAQYRKMAELLGVDPQSELPIPFDIGDPQFTRAYFEELHHPYEEQGIDFWWLDWQQDTVSSLPGLDPLWWLNHLHFYDLARDGRKQPFIFSRWGGLGNHRYPIGFSGDTLVTWDSLAFQPYFTATAANVNYGWWSHDIGGHMSGIEDAELYTRWVQSGVFSPILRLHSTKNPFHERRPWGYDAETERVTTNALRLRQALLPYLQAMAWRNHVDSIPLVRPLYYDHPGDDQAYHCPDQYLFGSELMAAPFTSPADADTRLSRQVMWLPDGDWFDFFYGDRICGDSWQPILGGLDDIPVLARAGAIVPLIRPSNWTADEGGEWFEINLFPGASRSFDLFDEEGAPGSSHTSIAHEWHGREWIVQIETTEDESKDSSWERLYGIVFRGVHADITIKAESVGDYIAVNFIYDADSKSLRLAPISVSVRSGVTITLTTEEDTLLAVDDRQIRSGRRMLKAFRMNSNVKLQIAAQLARMQDDPTLLDAFQPLLTNNQYRALAELMTGAGTYRTKKRDGSGEEIILWNNHALEAVSHIVLGEQRGDRRDTGKQPLPKYAVLAIESVPQGQKGVMQ